VAVDEPLTPDELIETLVSPFVVSCYDFGAVCESAALAFDRFAFLGPSVALGPTTIPRTTGRFFRSLDHRRVDRWLRSRRHHATSETVHKSSARFESVKYAYGTVK
jgi:hypothetical protein